MRSWAGNLAAIALFALPAASYGQDKSVPPSSPSASAPQPTARTDASLNVLELFTSQGCSACPAADALLRSFAARNDTVALSFSVDYWDHLGWKDTLAIAKSGHRQKAYAKALGSGNVYTPQVVINGAAEAIGSHLAEIDKAIQATSGARKQSVAIDARNAGGRVVVDVASGHVGLPTSGTIWLVVVSPHVEVKIKQGENRGKMLNYSNVVREITPVGMWSGKAIKLELPASALMAEGNRCAVLLQVEEGGPIIGAAWMQR